LSFLSPGDHLTRWYRAFTVSFVFFVEY
jgi:hypothetical protein